jgi:hypothetical protein
VSDTGNSGLGYWRVTHINEPGSYDIVGGKPSCGIKYSDKWKQIRERNALTSVYDENKSMDVEAKYH